MRTSDALYVIIHMILCLVPMAELPALLVHTGLFVCYLLVHLFSQ